jgi:hypothetical protein
MANATETSKIKILSAAQTPKTLEALAHAGIVRGQYGITALRARKIVEAMAKSGALTVSYDLCHCRLFAANS